jgi:alcohol dehydrogenase class IV
MTAFTFQTTPSVICAPRATRKLGPLVAGAGARRVALVTDATVLGLGLAEPALAGLAAAGVAVWTFAEVTPDPPEAMVLRAAAEARAERVDAVVGLGGGSALDTAKLVALLAASDQPLAETYGVGKATGRRLPLALAPTTAGTGSEVTPIAIVTTGRDEKQGVVAPQLLPDWAVLDADLTLGLPAAVTAATGVDAMVHAIEAYTSRLRKNVVSDCLARQALALLAANIRTACAAPGDRAAREAMLIGSTLAGMAFANAPVAAVHALAYPLGGRFHVPHGLSNALVLPHVLAYNLPAAQPLYADLAPLAFPHLADRAPARRAEGFIDGLRALGSELGMPTRLREVGVAADDLPALAADAMRQTRLLVNNPRPMTEAAARAIYAAAL